MSIESSSDFSQNWLKLKQELDSEKNKKMSEGGFTVVTKKKNKLKRKFDEATKFQNKGDKEKMEIGSEINQTEIKAKRIKEEIVIAEKVKKNNNETAEITKILALDCEYVGIGHDGSTDSLARVSVVNADGVCVYDKYVVQSEPVIDFRTEVSGIRPGHLKSGESFTKVQHEVHKLLADKIVVGHALHNDFRVLNLTHPRKLTRDSAKYKPLRALANSKHMPSLKYLAKEVLGVQIQQGEHDSITDARIALRIYLMHKKKWDADMQKHR